MITEADYLKTLPSIDDDKYSWNNCGPCIQGNKSHGVPYKECGDCIHVDHQRLALLVEQENLVEEYDEYGPFYFEDPDDGSMI